MSAPKSSSEVWNFVLMCANVSDLISQSILVTGDDRRNEKVKHFAGGIVAAVILLNVESVCEIITENEALPFCRRALQGGTALHFPCNV